MKDIDDYDLYDLDFEEWARRGRVAFGLENGNPQDEQSVTLEEIGGTPDEN